MKKFLLLSTMFCGMYLHCSSNEIDFFSGNWGTFGKIRLVDGNIAVENQGISLEQQNLELARENVRLSKMQTRKKETEVADVKSKSKGKIKSKSKKVGVYY